MHEILITMVWRFILHTQGKPQRALIVPQRPERGVAVFAFQAVMPEVVSVGPWFVVERGSADIYHLFHSINDRLPTE